jgi:hypothetical protein
MVFTFLHLLEHPIYCCCPCFHILHFLQATPIYLSSSPLYQNCLLIGKLCNKITTFMSQTSSLSAKFEMTISFLFTVALSWFKGHTLPVFLLSHWLLPSSVPFVSSLYWTSKWVPQSLQQGHLNRLYFFFFFFLRTGSCLYIPGWPQVWYPTALSLKDWCYTCAEPHWLPLHSSTTWFYPNS